MPIMFMGICIMPMEFIEFIGTCIIGLIDCIGIAIDIGTCIWPICIGIWFMGICIVGRITKVGEIETGTRVRSQR